MGDKANRGRLAVGAGNRHHRDGGHREGGRFAGVGAIQPLDSLLEDARHRPGVVETGLEQPGRFSGEAFGSRAPAPGKGDHHLVRLGTHTSADCEAGTSRLGQPADGLGRKPGQETMPLLAQWRADRDRGNLEPAGTARHLAGWHLHPGA